MAIAADLVKHERYQDSATFLHAWMDKFEQSSRATLNRLAATTESSASLLERSTKATSRNALQSAISPQSIVGVVAGVGLLVAAYAMLSDARRQRQTHSPWTDYVQNKREARLGDGQFRR